MFAGAEGAGAGDGVAGFTAECGHVAATFADEEAGAEVGVEGRVGCVGGDKHAAGSVRCAAEGERHDGDGG